MDQVMDQIGMNQMMNVADWDWIRPSTVGGIALWSLGLYWAFSPLKNQLIDWLADWLTFDRQALLSSLLSTLPFLILSVGIVWLTDLTLGQSWAASLGLLVCVSSGVYELGRHDSAQRSSQ